MKLLVILNDPPYGTERCYNAVRLARAIAKREGNEVRLFLFGDSVGCAVANQKVPEGFYRLDHMLGDVVRSGGDVSCCGSCMDARGIPEDALLKGAQRGSLEQSADWTAWADKVLVF